MPAVRSRGRTMSGPAQPKPRSDAYIGLLLLSLVAQLAGAVFLYLDYSRYTTALPPKVQALSAAPTPAPSAPGQPGVNPPPVIPPAPGNPPQPPGNPPQPPGFGMQGGAPK
jgi:hypothetical protein